MKPSSKDEVAGKMHEVKGAVKQKVGKLTKNPDLEVEGTVEKVAGRVQKKIGQAKKVLGQ
jgi:CsbD-like.